VNAAQHETSPAHLRWLSEVGSPTPAQPMVLPAYGRAVSAHSDRLQRLEQARHDHVTTWRLYPVVEARQALRGGPCTVAVPLVAAMGALTRFESPGALLAEVSGADPLGTCLWRTTSPGLHDQGRYHPGLAGAGRRRLGLPLSRHGQPPAAPATRNTTQSHLGQQLESPGQTVYTVPTPRLTRYTGPCGHRGHCP